MPSGQRAQDARASPWKRLRSRSLSVVLGLVAVVCPASAQPVIDYPDGSTNASGIVISTNTTQLQVLVGSATQSGVISETGGARPIQKIGVGTLNLTAANTYTGLTTISAGVLNIQTATALGTVAAGTSVTSGAALQLQGGITVGAEALTLNGLGVGGAGGALRNISGTNIYGGAITLGSASRINSDAGTLTLGGAVGGTGLGLTVGGAGNVTFNAGLNTGAAGTLTKDGAGTLTLTAAGTYTGLTTISAGVVNIQNATALGTTAAGTSVTSGAALQLQGGITVGAEALTLNGLGVGGADGALRNISGTNTYGGAITLGVFLRRGPPVR